MLVMAIMPHTFPSEFRILLSTQQFKSLIQYLLKIPPSLFNHPDHLLPILKSTVILCLPRKVEVWNSSYLHCPIILEEGDKPLPHISNLVSSCIYEIVMKNKLILNWYFYLIFFISGSPYSVICGLRVWRCVECLPGNNTTNQSPNKFCKGC